MAEKRPEDADESPPQVSLEEHEETFNGFLKVAAVVGIISVLVLIFLAIVGT
ncbi:MAG: aa3-type cytochrome c oxidase subunit IV [Pseudomonadota bacterium]